MVQIIDMNTVLLESVVALLRSNSVTSINNYIHAQLLYFQDAYIVFAFFLTFGLVILIKYGFSRLKQMMLDTNKVLRIIPYESLSQQDRDELKLFF